jgi:hypothetical protein
MEQTSVTPRPFWAGLVIALAIFSGACLAALVIDDSFRPPVYNSKHPQD